MRNFENIKGLRDDVEGKLHPYGFTHPLCDNSFYRYMDKHRKMSNGELRAPNNWWDVWSKDVSIDCLARHVEDLKCIHAGLFVYKERIQPKGERTRLSTVELDYKALGWEKVTEEDACNAIRFNADAYKLDILK